MDDCREPCLFLFGVSAQDSCLARSQLSKCDFFKLASCFYGRILAQSFFQEPFLLDLHETKLNFTFFSFSFSFSLTLSLSLYIYIYIY